MDEYRNIEEALERRIQGWVDDHPILGKLNAIARRNVATVGAGSGMSALTRDELRQIGLAGE